MSTKLDPLMISLVVGLLVGGGLILALVFGSAPTNSGQEDQYLPSFTLRLEIVDAATGAPVPATVELDGQVLAQAVSEFKRAVPLLDTGPQRDCLARTGDPTNCPGSRRLEVRAPGYVPWILTFRPHVQPGRVVGGPVRLERLPESIKPVIDGPGPSAYLDALLPLLAGARESVDVLLFKLSASGGAALEALIAAAGRGVVVRVMLDHGTFQSADRANEAARDRLEAAGVQVRFDDPDVETHAKLVVVDRSTVLLHSGNWNAPAFFENVEVGLLLRSEALASQVAAWFQALWAGRDPASLTAPFRPLTVAGRPALALLDSGRSRPYRNTVTALLQRAKESVDVLMYEVSDAAAVDALLSELEAALGRGVRARLLLDATAASWGQARTATSQRRAAELRRAGARVCFDDPETLMHAKVVVVDGEKVVLGSTNWTGFGLTDNVEADAFVRSEELARALESLWGGGECSN